MSRKSRVCPICGGTDKKFLYRNAMAAVGDIDLSYTIVSCAQCKSVFADELAHREEYGKYYSMHSKYDTGSEPDKETCIIHDKLMNIIFRNYNEPIRCIVDIGCGNGDLLERFGKKIHNAMLVGIDPSPESAQKRLKKFSNAEVKQGFIGNSIELNHDGNIFCLTAVLEHLDDPLSALLSIYKNISDKDCLVIEVPNIACFDGQESEPYGEFSLEHINYFSADSLERLLSRAGFSVIATESVRFKYGGSLLAIARKKNIASLKKTINDDIQILKYIEDSERHWEKTIGKKIQNINDDFFVFGAGSHTAKLLVRYKDIFSKYCMGIIDNNKNLHNTTMGNFIVISPNELRERMSTILISSFKAEEILEEVVGNIYPSARILKLYS